jgi:hypothetical protein
MKYQLLIVVLLGLSLVTAGAWANGADISGTWEFTIERAAEQGGKFSAMIVFKQTGEKLSGAYSGRFGEHKVIGAVKGDKAVFSWETEPTTDGGKLPCMVIFNGAIESPNKMAGAVECFCGEGQKCKWTATKKK